MEINSKSGLYPLYAAYSLYRTKLGGKEESDYLPEELLKVWDEAVAQIYVLCQTPMAMDITNRTLVGYRSVSTNVKYDKKLMDKLKVSAEKASKDMNKGSYWGKEVREMGRSIGFLMIPMPNRKRPHKRCSRNCIGIPKQHSYIIADLLAELPPVFQIFDWSNPVSESSSCPSVPAHTKSKATCMK